MNPQNVEVTLSLSTVLIYASLGLLVILGTKSVIALLKLFALPQKDGANAWGFLGAIMSMFGMLPVSIIAAIVVALIVASSGGSLVTALVVCAALGAVSITLI